jgi:hypothetical protein
MPKAKTWIWIIVGFVGLCFLALVAMAGASVYFVRQHIQVESSSDVKSQKAFDAARAAFKGQRPLLEMDSLNRPRQTRSLTDLPTSSVKPTEMVVMVWDQDKERLVHVSMPFWLLKMGRRKIDLSGAQRKDFDFERLNLDINELERIGPALVVDLKSSSGERVLVWTQ